VNKKTALVVSCRIPLIGLSRSRVGLTTKDRCKEVEGMDTQRCDFAGKQS